MQNSIIDYKHNDNRNHSRQNKRFCIPYRLICWQAVTSIIHVGAYIFKNCITQNISDQCPYKRYDNRQCHVMTNQFSPRITGCTECSDHTGFFCNRIAGRDSKYKCHDHNNDIKKHCNHCFVTSHVITCKNDRLVLVLWDKILQCNNFAHCFHQVFRNFSFLKLCLWFLIIYPCIIVLQFILIQSIKFFFCHNTDTKFYGIKHGIAVVLKQTAVIRQSNQTGDFPTLLAVIDRVSDFQLIIVCIHTVNRDLTCLFRKLAFHQADFVDICTVLKETHRTAI